MEPICIRPIQPADNAAVASIIRNTLEEFGIGKRPGTAYYDTATDDIYASFQATGSRYNVALLHDNIAGGAGIYPSPGLPEHVCELVKMYLGYRQVYLETMPELQKAMSVYEKFGFYYLQSSMGNTGHYSCTIWMLKDL
jgi:putative acetyltransferase